MGKAPPNRLSEEEINFPSIAAPVTILIGITAGEMSQMDIAKLFGMFDGLMRLATVGLILVAIGSVVVFYRVFQSDFNGPE